MLLRYALRQTRYHRGIQFRPGRRLHYTLPAGHAAVVVPRHYRIIRQREDVVHHLGVAVKNRRQVLAEAGALCNALKKPDVSVKPVEVLALVGNAPLLTVGRQLVYLAQVPPLRKDKLSALLHAGIQVLLPRDKLQLGSKRAPVQQAVLPLVVLGQREWMRARVHVLSVLVGRQPVDAVLFRGSGHGLVGSCINYTNV